MNRNPLPRGRSVESVDWLTELFKFLPPTTGSHGVPIVRVPLTLTLLEMAFYPDLVDVSASAEHV